LASLEQAWKQHHHPGALADATLICLAFRQPMPHWLAMAVFDLIETRMTPQERNQRDDNWKHFVRWQVVKELRERRHELLADGDDSGSTWERTFEAASDALQDTSAAGSAEAMKKSYKKVQREMKAERGNHFTLTPRRRAESENGL
jgi:hypothetical protein